MQRQRRLSRLERILAVGLSLAWTIGGGAALRLAWLDSRWGLGLAAVLALVYGLAWLRVAALARLLGWAELVAPWRARR
ncbi:MAG TPA: hypothetical protein VII31_00655 [Caldimonas sp.]|jgi:hypothetical protein